MVVEAAEYPQFLLQTFRAFQLLSLFLAVFLNLKYSWLTVSY